MLRGVGNGPIETLLEGRNNRGGGCLQTLKIFVFLAKRISFTYLCEQ